MQVNEVSFSEPNKKCFECKVYSVSAETRICNVCHADYNELESQIAHLKGEKLMLKERYAVEVFYSKTLVIEVDPLVFNDRTVNELKKECPEINTVEGHLAAIGANFSKGKVAGAWPHYGLVRVNNECGGRAMPSMYPESGINIVPVVDNFKNPVVNVEKINPVRRRATVD